MDRQIVYPGALPRSFDILEQENNTLIALGYLAGAAIGYLPFVDQLLCTVGSGLSVNIGSGMIGQIQAMDGNGIALGGLPLDLNAIVKLGINQSSTNIALVAPGTAGFSINYLIECQFQEADTLPVVLPYYNASNPAVPYTGPANSGTSQNTRRRQTVALQLKAGAAATTGTQPTPGADAGWFPLYVATVNYGDAAVQANKIYIAPGAIFLGSKVQQSRTKLMANQTLYVSTTGNDVTNNGLSTDTAFASPQAAWNAIINNYDLNGFSITVKISNGTYTPLYTAGQPSGLGPNSQITFTGNISSPGSVILNAVNSNAVNCTQNAQIVLKGLTLTATGSGVNGSGIYCSGSGTVLYSNIIFAACGQDHQLAVTGSIQATGPYTISGNAASHIHATYGGLVNISGAGSVTLTGTPAFSTGFANTRGGQIIAYGFGVSFSGSATGLRYAGSVGLIDTASAGISFFPGSIAGTTTSTWEYQ